MKKFFVSIISLMLVLGVMPVVIAEGDDVDGGIDIIVDDPTDPPEIYTDITERSWYPNDQTIYTAEEYGDGIKVNFYGDDYYDLDVRGNYFFTGETVTYYVLVRDPDGEDDIDTVILERDDGAPQPAGACSEIDPIAPPLFWISGLTLIPPGFGMPAGTIYNDGTMNLYRCVLIVQAGWNGNQEVYIEATDFSGPNTVYSAWTDYLNFNPPLSVTLTGTVDFGTVEPGSTATSSSVYLNNVGSDGVIMDMYVAADDYFTDPTNPAAICGLGNGIPYDAFSYYATKGSLDSGSNDGSEDGLGANCPADPDEYTELPSHSGDIADMCRIINHAEDDDEGSFLTQGSSMSLTFQLDVPLPCEGIFTDGSFHFVGRVV